MHDLKYAVRMIGKSPGFSALVVLTLGLAIGANTVTFSFANVLALRPLPIRDQDTLGFIYMQDPQRGDDRALVSIPDLLDYRASLRSFDTIAGMSPASFTMTGRGDAVALTASRVTTNLFTAWGIPIVAGRGFVDGEDAPGAARGVVLSHRFWQRQFGGAPDIIGEPLMLDGQPYTILGVLSPAIEIGNLSLIDVWAPIVLDPAAPRDRRDVRVCGRLKAGVTLEQADAEVRAAAQRLQHDYPETNAGWGARVASTKEAMLGENTMLVLALQLLVVCFVLLIACANIANLILARATGRRRELAVRVALGGSRSRMVRQLITESTVLGLLGGALGLGIAYGGLAAIKAAAYEPFFELIVIDGNVLAFTAVLSLLTPLLFSILPAVQASRPDVNEVLKESTARAGGGERGRRSRAVLVVAQLALAMMLLIVSALLVRTMIAMNRAPLGFEPSGLLTVTLDLPEWRYSSDAAVADYYDRLFARLSSLPGVEQVAAIDRLPVLGGESPSGLEIEGRPYPRPEDKPWAARSVATDGFFAAARIPIVAGRAFDRRDVAGSRRVAVVNEEAARRYWGRPEAALGGRIRMNPEDGWMEVVGVCANVMRPDLEGANPHVYVSAHQQPVRRLSVLARAADPAALLGQVRSELRALDVDVPVQNLRTVDEAIDDELSSSRILFSMFGAFAGLALFLAASGLYAVVSYSVSQRVQEIGIRMALGAVPSDIRRLVTRQTIVLVTLGTAIGLAGGAALARTTSSVLYNVAPTDPSTYIGVAVLLGSVAFLASWLPVRRATRIDPLTALRTE